jgi:hypothetical protein
MFMVYKLGFSQKNREWKENRNLSLITLTKRANLWEDKNLSHVSDCLENSSIG